MIIVERFQDLLSLTSASPSSSPVSPSPHPSQLLPDLLFGQNALPKVVVHFLWGDLDHLPSLWILEPKE